jgi:predicted transcriptional regulator
MAEVNAEALQAQHEQIQALDAQIVEKVQAAGDAGGGEELQALIAERNEAHAIAAKMDRELNPPPAPEAPSAE